MIWLYILIFIISCLILARSSTWIIRSLIRIARFLKWQEFVVASLLMAFATSLPELFVAIFAAIHKEPHLSFGNVIGSNIVALTLVTGISALMANKLRFQGQVLQKSSFYAPLIASLPLFIVLDGTISRSDGAVLFITSIIYFHWLLSQKDGLARAFYNKFKNHDAHFWSFFKNLIMFLIGVGLLLLSSEGIVRSALYLAQTFNLSLLIIGIFLVALGTSIPEIAFGIKSATMRHKSMALGNVMGSVVVNSSLVLGTTALIQPFEVPSLTPYFSGLIFTIITALFFAFFAKTDREITKKEALFLLLIYIAFLIFEILLGRAPKI